MAADNWGEWSRRMTPEGWWTTKELADAIGATDRCSVNAMLRRLPPSVKQYVKKRHFFGCNLPGYSRPFLRPWNMIPDWLALLIVQWKVHGLASRRYHSLYRRQFHQDAPPPSPWDPSAARLDRLLRDRRRRR